MNDSFGDGIGKGLPLDGFDNLGQHDIAGVGVAPVFAGAKVGPVAGRNVDEFIGRSISRAFPKGEVLLKAKHAPGVGKQVLDGDVLSLGIVWKPGVDGLAEGKLFFCRQLQNDRRGKQLARTGPPEHSVFSDRYFGLGRGESGGHGPDAMTWNSHGSGNAGSTGLFQGLQ
jgi:hypothetical protein